MRNLTFLLIVLTIRSIAASSVAEDGFPTGNDSAEGIAADFARAFLARDFEAFRATCIPLYGGGELRDSYKEFRAQIQAEMAAEKARPEPSPCGPRAIGKVFLARHLSRNGPASYGYAVHEFDDVMFVDVGMFLWNKKRHINRTLVVKKNGRWWVHPAPELDPMLSIGLNDESASTKDWTEKQEAKTN